MNINFITPIQQIKLEFIRPGPAHNQLLSPQTSYFVLCGEGGPVTEVRMPFEHQELLDRLSRLRYESGKDPAIDKQRLSEVRNIGVEIGRILSQIPMLLSELGEANGRLVHLKLIISASELSLVPFEFAIGTDGFPGYGSPLFLQAYTPISLTREIRHKRRLPFIWNRSPRILYAFAAPDGLTVPADAHLKALRSAIEPWLEIRNPEMIEERVEGVKKILTVLPNATFKQIREACAQTEYTHIHILAHGAPLENSGDKRYGVALCSDYDQSKDIIEGEKLAIALTARDSWGNTKFCPTFVTLVTCDSGNTESILTPGGSIAHELHAAGIPWVIASQFPLWMSASVIAAEVLYQQLLQGIDPRRVIHELRQRLRTDAVGTHDWASIVAYATIPVNFDEQVNAFREKQIRRRLEVKFDRIDELVGANVDIEQTQQIFNSTEHGKEIASLCKSIRNELKIWREESEAMASLNVKAERLGMSAASEKRIGIAYSLLASSHAVDSSNILQWAKESTKAYEASQKFYRESVEIEPNNHWAISQYLSVTALPSLANKTAFKSLSEGYGPLWIAARQIFELELNRARGVHRAYALGVLAELALLGVAYGGPDFNDQQAREDIIRYCKEMRDLLDPDEFPLFSIQRQFRRYIKYWDREEWRDLAYIALQTLSGIRSDEEDDVR